MTTTNSWQSHSLNSWSTDWENRGTNNGSTQFHQLLNCVSKMVRVSVLQIVSCVTFELFLVEKHEFEIVETYGAAPFNFTVDLCHPKHIALFQCIQIKTFINCPLVKFNQHEYCFDWKDYAIFCVKNFKNLPMIDLNKIL